MRIRTVISGIAAAVLCILILWIQYFRIEPSKFVPNWPYPPLPSAMGYWLPIAVLFLCGIIIFAFGWTAARWNWSRTWQASVTSGVSTGLLAGFLIYDFIGVFWFGVQGNAEILGNVYNPVTEAEGVKMIAESLIKTGNLIYINFIWCVLVCVTLGALGGFFSAIDLKDRWGRPPRKTAGWLFRLPAYLLVYFGIINLAITMAVMNSMADRLMNTVAQLNEQYGIVLEHGFDNTEFLRVNFQVGWFFAVLPIGCIVGWFIRLHRQSGSISLSSITGLVAMFVSLLLFIWFLSPSMFFMSLSPAVLISLAAAGILALWVGLMTRDDSGDSPYRSSDWFGFLIGYGILGGTQIVMGAVAFALPTDLIGIINIPHLVRGELMDQSTFSQLGTFFRIQARATIAAMIISLVFALIIVNLVSFIRKLFHIQEIHQLTENHEQELA